MVFEREKKESSVYSAPRADNYFSVTGIEISRVQSQSTDLALGHRSEFPSQGRMHSDAGDVMNGSE